MEGLTVDPNCRNLASLASARTVRFTRYDLPLIDVPPPPGWEREPSYPAALLLSHERILNGAGLPVMHPATTDRWEPTPIICNACGHRGRLGSVYWPTSDDWPHGPVAYLFVPPGDDSRSRLRERMAARSGRPLTPNVYEENVPYAALVTASTTPRYLPAFCRHHGWQLVDRDKASDPASKNARSIPLT